MTQEDYVGALVWNRKGIEILNQITKNVEPIHEHDIFRDRVKSYQIMGENVSYLDIRGFFEGRTVNLVSAVFLRRDRRFFFTSKKLEYGVDFILQYTGIYTIMMPKTA